MLLQAGAPVNGTSSNNSTLMDEIHSTIEEVKLMQKNKAWLQRLSTAVRGLRVSADSGTNRNVAHERVIGACHTSSVSCSIAIDP